VVQETGIGEVTIEEGETRVTVRRSDESASTSATPALGIPAPSDMEEPPPLVVPRDDVIRVESPMVGTFYRAPEPGAAPFVEEGDPVAPGQTLCILEAMKLMNEVKAEVEAVVRRICVDNAQAVQYGDVLFELEPLNGRPLDAL
jgi:oxaloacetate decarboxylase alpha subunit